MDTEQHSITSTCGQYTRDVWLLRAPSNQASKLAVFLDAEFYLRDMDCAPLLQELMEHGTVPPLTCLFVSQVDAQVRHHDFACNDAYSKFIAEDVVAWADNHCQGLDDTSALICGVSMSGLASAYATLLYPSVFSDSLCQSGSFWWLAGRDLPLPETTARFWLSAGDEETATNITHPPTDLYQEISQIDGVENAVGALKSLGGTVHYSVFSGGHGFAPWREELASALRWLLGGSK